MGATEGEMRGSWVGAGALSVLVACASSPMAPSVEPVQEFALAPGESAFVSGTGLTVRFERVTNDSRCPAGVLCITAGNAAVAVTVTQAGRAELASLRTDGTGPALFGEWALSLARLDPLPLLDHPIAPGDYKATFRVDPSP